MGLRDFEPACRRMEWLDPFYRRVWEKAFVEGTPISGTFELTPRCNFNCKMCYVHLKSAQIPRYGRELTAREWIRIAHEAWEEGTTWLCITGGEPLLHPEFSVIWQELSQMGFFLALQTNASLITGPIADLLERYPPWKAKVTLYGTSDQVYVATCGVTNGFERVNEGIHTLLGLGIPVQLVSTIIHPNEQDLLNMAWYAQCHGLSWLPTGSVKPSLRGADTNVFDVRLENKNRPVTSEQVEYFLQHPIDPNRKPCTYCKDYRVGYWITWNGEMRFCSFLNEPNIPVHELTFQRAWRELLCYEETLDWPEECKTCSASTVCLKCAASLATLSGSVKHAPKSYCKSVQMLYKQKKGDLL